MGYALTWMWRQADGTGVREFRETVEAGGSYAEVERRARDLWSATASSPGTVEATAIVEIQDATGRTVARLRDSGSGVPALSTGYGADPAALRWLDQLREIGTLVERVRRSTDRVSILGPSELAGEAGAEILDACASRLGALIYRVDEIMRRSLAANGRDPASRFGVRRSVEATMDAADVDGYLALTTDGRIPVPPSTLPLGKVPAAVGALLRVSAAMLRACAAIEAHAAGVDPEPGPVLTGAGRAGTG